MDEDLHLRLRRLEDGQRNLYTALEYISKQVFELHQQLSMTPAPVLPPERPPLGHVDPLPELES